MPRLLALLPLAWLLACGDKDSSTEDDDDGGPPVGTDADGDGFAAMPEGDDCDDADPAINPFAAELCDEIDNDCDGVVDEDSAEDAVVWYLDDDEDGFGDPEQSDKACEAPEDDGPWVRNGDDCDDTDDDTHPDAEEVCNGVDDDCDDDTDEDDAVDATTWYADEDEDGFGDPTVFQVSCQVDDDGSWVDNDEDCDDTDPGVNPDTPEVCNDIDDDCDGLVDDEDDDVDETTWSTFYEDLDGDGYGNSTAPVLSCSSPADHVADATDCDDGDAEVHPGATEVCDDRDTDEDCSGAADDDDPDVAAAGLSTWVLDADRDGYGSSTATPVFACDDPSAGPTTYVAGDDTDCDDSDAGINPGEDEVCDDRDTDEDCSGAADDDDPGTLASSMSTWYRDADRDGYGSSTGATTQCEDPSTGATTYVADATDCDDGDADINPGETEVCDARDTDEDCSGAADDDDPGTLGSTKSTWYRDADGDGFGDPDTSGAWCDDPSDASADWTADDSDCDDTDAAVNPEADEICDGIDNDCDAATSEAGGALFTSASGVITDLTTTLAAGTRARPTELTLDEAGELTLCGGTVYAKVVISAEVDLVGRYGATIDAGDQSSVVVIEASASAVGLSGLTLTGGDADEPYGSTTWAGGGVWCSSAAVSFSDVTISGCTSSDYGGGVYGASCDFTGEDLVVTGNTAGNSGAGFFLSGGSLSLSDSEISENEAGSSGGGLTTRSYAEVDLVDSWVIDNSAGTQGGAIYNTVDTIACTATSPGAGGFLRNDSPSYGAVRFANSIGEVSSDDCDWGDRADDNGPADFYSSYWSPNTYNVDGIGTFTCYGGSAGCD